MPAFVAPLDAMRRLLLFYLGRGLAYQISVAGRKIVFFCLIDVQGPDSAKLFGIEGPKLLINARLNFVIISGLFDSYVCKYHLLGTPDDVLLGLIQTSRRGRRRAVLPALRLKLRFFDLLQAAIFVTNELLYQVLAKQSIPLKVLLPDLLHFFVATLPTDHNLLILVQCHIGDPD